VALLLQYGQKGTRRQGRRLLAVIRWLLQRDEPGMAEQDDEGYTFLHEACDWDWWWIPGADGRDEDISSIALLRELLEVGRQKGIINMQVRFSLARAHPSQYCTFTGGWGEG
jgi:hypothetical protein